MNMQIETEDLIGIPFEWGGQNTSYDCYTLCQEIAKRAGYTLPDKEGIVNKVARAKMMEEAKCDFIQLERPEPYCIVAFKKLGHLCHVGTVLPGNTRFIHIRKCSGVIISRLNNPVWKFMREGYYKYNGNCNS